MNEDYDELQLKYHAQEQQIARLRKQQQQMKDYISQFETKMLFSRVPDKKNNNRSTVTVEDPSKCSVQIDKQMQSALTLLKNIRNSIETLNKNNHKMKTKDFDELDQEISDLKVRLKDAKNQIKLLQVVKSKQQKAIEQIQKEQNGNKLANLVDDLNKSKELLQATYAKRKHYDQNLKKKRQQVAKLEKIYQQQCSNRGEKPLTFADFMERRDRKDKNSHNAGQSKNKQIKSVRDILKTQIQSEMVNTKRNYEQMIVKRDIAVNSLNNAVRKRERQIKQVKNKLKILEEQNANLLRGLAEAEKQVQTATNRSQNNYDQPRKSSLKLPQI